MGDHIITQVAEIGAAADLASDGDTLSVHPDDGGRPGLYQVVDHPNNEREIRHVSGPMTLRGCGIEERNEDN